MVEIKKVNTKKQYYEEIENLLQKNRSDFIPYGRYADPSFDDGIDPEYFNNYRNPNEEMLAALHDDKLIGFMCFHINCHREDYPLTPPYTLISLTLVDGQYRGKGVGRQFNEFIIRMYHENKLDDVIIRGTWESNYRQRYLYEEYGFEEHSRKESHRLNGDDTIYYVYQD